MSDTTFKFLLSVMTLFSGVIGWKLSKIKSAADLKKTMAETEKLELDADEKQITNFRALIDVYRQISNDLKKELQEVHTECRSLKLEVQGLREENGLLKNQLNLLMKEVKKNNT